MGFKVENVSNALVLDFWMIDDNMFKGLTFLSSVHKNIVPTSGLTARTLTHHML
jgi:hypothetical protein